MQEEFSILYNQWKEGNDPPIKLIHLLSRLYEEKSFANYGGYLATDRIRNRGFNFVKINNCCKLSTTRHYNAWENKLRTKRVVEIWKIDVMEERAELIGTRDWTVSDPE